MENRKDFVITRVVSAPLSLVWDAHTKPEHLTKWWGPKGLKMKTCKVDLRPGGIFHYGMEAPNGEVMWGKFVYREIIPKTKLVFVVSFSDEKAGYSRHPMAPNWPMEMLNIVTFSESNGKTTITLTGRPINASTDEENIYYSAFDSMNQGFGGTYDQLDAYLQAQSTLRNQLKTKTMARTSTYLNFPGNTEEAFNFYKSVFKTELNGDGFQRFGDIPPVEGQPPLSAADKKLILHVELPIVGGHVLMATDAPESMGFKVIQGNNMHINLEPETRKETKRLYDALSAGGNVTMELMDMFWGAYYGSCTDKFGINWMFNCTEKK